jgi:hypothetical protein
VLDHRGGGSYYVSNAGSANVSGYTVNGKGVPRLVGTAAAMEGIALGARGTGAERTRQPLSLASCRSRVDTSILTESIRTGGFPTAGRPVS